MIPYLIHIHFKPTALILLSVVFFLFSQIHHSGEKKFISLPQYFWPMVPVTFTLFLWTVPTKTNTLFPNYFLIWHIIIIIYSGLALISVPFPLKSIQSHGIPSSVFLGHTDPTLFSLNCRIHTTSSLPFHLHLNNIPHGCLMCSPTLLTKSQKTSLG